jgi:hypothetical protein
MSARHEHLVQALERLAAAIAHQDAQAAGVAMEEALGLFATTPNPGDDERLAPLVAQCEAAARELHARLGAAVRASAATTKAVNRYAVGGRGSLP